MRIWVDDVRPAPKGYIWCKSVNEAKNEIVHQEKIFHFACNQVRYHFLNDNQQFVDDYLEESKNAKIDVIDIDHDAGDFACDGGDYIKLLDWLEETGRNYPIRIHSMNPVGVQNMRRIIQKNGWREIF